MYGFLSKSIPGSDSIRRDEYRFAVVAVVILTCRSAVPSEFYCDFSFSKPNNDVVGQFSLATVTLSPLSRSPPTYVEFDRVPRRPTNPISVLSPSAESGVFPTGIIYDHDERGESKSTTAPKSLT